MWKLTAVNKIGRGLLELHLDRLDKVENNYHMPARTNYDHLIQVVSILTENKDMIDKLTLICKKRKVETVN